MPDYSSADMATVVMKSPERGSVMPLTNDQMARICRELLWLEVHGVWYPSVEATKPATEFLEEYTEKTLSETRAQLEQIASDPNLVLTCGGEFDAQNVLEALEENKRLRDSLIFLPNKAYFNTCFSDLEQLGVTVSKILIPRKAQFLIKDLVTFGLDRTRQKLDYRIKGRMDKIGYLWTADVILYDGEYLEFHTDETEVYGPNVHRVRLWKRNSTV